MQYNFELKLGVFHSLDKPFTSTDVAVFLNRSQDDIVDSRYSKSLLPQGSYFEADAKARTELSSLIKNTIVSTGSFGTGTALHSNAVFADLPSDYLYSLKESCVVNYVDCNSDNVQKTAKVLPIRHDEYEASINDPFGKPYNELIWRMDFGVTGAKKHELIHADSQSIQTYNLRYLKTPTRIDIINGVDCELHVSIHEEVVDRAVQLAIASIPKSNNVQQKQES